MMGRLYTAHLGLGMLTAAILGGCADSRQMTPPADREASTTAQRRQDPRRSPGVYWYELGKLIPGYGGHFIDPGTRVVWVYLLNPETQAQRAKSVLSRREWSWAAPPSAVRTLQGRYGINDLLRWHSAMHALIGPGDIYGVGLDFSHNAVSLHVNPGTDRRMVEQRIKALDIPLDAVRIVERELPPAV